ncbi:hypothetical protein B0H14DRAFT_3156360 [Mycena olivaceomarginata]|nr:hypothetical protein B0H14DRAFT_3156360 [Mycena olivaceomarginata]
MGQVAGRGGCFQRAYYGKPRHAARLAPGSEKPTKRAARGHAEKTQAIEAEASSLRRMLKGRSLCPSLASAYLSQPSTLPSTLANDGLPSRSCWKTSQPILKGSSRLTLLVC